MIVRTLWRPLSLVLNYVGDALPKPVKWIFDCLTKPYNNNVCRRVSKDLSSERATIAGGPAGEVQYEGKWINALLPDGGQLPQIEHRPQCSVLL
ncbi:hypothetical protein ACTMU2_35505 (plasmid) [Cupriavidus basilensis]|uniref:hypothetical protein n=1 Tax=unclassified Cupriavidus TaxID=2640874 RepID=UPI0010F7E1AB|nr:MULTISPECIES: hypothetical protein [unclassified Cupriavidus]MWL92123.1 hypothetical protein [Cupriavidus sp. SW-Y-13]